MSVKSKVTEATITADSPAPAPVAPVAKRLDATLSNLKDDMGKPATGFEPTQTTMKEGMEKAMKTAEELVAFGQGNVEALIKASQIWASGMQDLSKQVAASTQANIDDTMSTFKALSAVKSFKDAVDVQTNYARATLEKTLSESGRLTDASFKLTEQALAPITARVTLAVEKFAKPV